VNSLFASGGIVYHPHWAHYGTLLPRPLIDFLEADYDGIVNCMRTTNSDLFGLPVVLDVQDESLAGKKVLREVSSHTTICGFRMIILGAGQVILSSSTIDRDNEQSLIVISDDFQSLPRPS
jgi:hypothetical protein